jgi:hypothetical protein
MDVAAVASAFASAQMGQQQMAILTDLLQTNAAMDASVAQLLQAGQQSLDPLANLAAGIGGNLDITA